MSGPLNADAIRVGAAQAAAVPSAAGWVPKGSIWFERGSSYLTRTPTSAGNRRTFSLSAWIKMASLDVDQVLWDAAPASEGNEDMFIIRSDNTPEWMSAGYDYSATPRVLRDPTAWYHILMVINSPNPNQSQRALMYINGRSINNAASNTMSLNYDAPFWNNTNLHSIGNRQHPSAGATSRYGSYLSEAIHLDGYVAIPTDFGEYDSNGVWRPIDPTDLVAANKGTNGFWLDFADSADLGNDVSTNNNDWAVTGFTAANYSNDRCADEAPNTGNYLTLNPLTKITGGSTATSITEGNTKWSRPNNGSNNQQCYGTFGATSGKFYFEFKLISASNGFDVGLFVAGETNGNEGAGNTGYDVEGYYLENYGTGSHAWKVTKTGQATGGAARHDTNDTSQNNDVCKIAVDFDAGKIWLGSVTHNTYYSGSDGSDIAFSTSSPTFTFTAGTRLFPYIFGHAQLNTCQFFFNSGKWTGTAPTDFKPWATSNLAAPAVTKSSDSFLPLLYEGNSTGQRVGNFVPFTDVYTASNSARFEDASSMYLSRSMGSPTSAYKWTFSTWFKRGKLGEITFIGQGDYNGVYTAFHLNGSNQFQFQERGSGVWNYLRTTSLEFKDTSTWYHLVVAWDTATSTTATKIYVNGNEVTSFTGTSTSPSSTNTASSWNSSGTAWIGEVPTNTPGYYMDGYLAETMFVDGYALSASVFGQTDTSTNIWVPKEVTTATINSAGGGSSGWGNNGFYLAYGSKNALGDDTSGETHDWTMNNMDTSNGSNQMHSSPSRNFAVLNSADSGGGTFTEGNLTLAPSNLTGTRATIGIELNTGKYYWESLQGASGGEIGWYSEDCNVGTSGGGQSNGAGNWNINYNGRYHFNPIGGTLTTSSDQTAWAFTTNDVVMCAYDSGTGNLWFGKNGTWFDAGSGASGDTGNPSTGANPFLTGVNTKIFPMVGDGTGTAANSQTVNFGSWQYFNGQTLSVTSSANGYFRYTVPTDFKAINQDNLPASTAGVTGFSWIKNRDQNDNHILSDRISGVGKFIPLFIDSAKALQEDVNSVQRFLKQGVQVGNMNAVNTDAESFVLWQWAANGAGTADADGMTKVSDSSQTSITVSANTTAGFSMIQYTGNGSASTIAHGLGAVPAFMIVNNITDDTTYKPQVYHKALGATNSLTLTELAGPSPDTSYWNDGSPAFSTSTFTVGSSLATNASAKTFKAYVWAEVEGYSKFGSYTGNSSPDGPVIDVGFLPSWVMIKRTDGSDEWVIVDIKRSPTNPTKHYLSANYADAERTTGTQVELDLLSNGFKLRVGHGRCNVGTYVYMAFAENPFGGSGVTQGKAN
jgi:hypothetical protein